MGVGDIAGLAQELAEGQADHHRDRPVSAVLGVAQYESIYRLCYLRGPAGIIVALAEQLG